MIAPYAISNAEDAAAQAAIEHRIETCRPLPKNARVECNKARGGREAAAEVVVDCRLSANSTDPRN